jgi:hypothetical protein
MEQKWKKLTGATFDFIFLWKRKGRQKLQKQIQNKILRKADIDKVRYGHERKVDDYRKLETP